MEESIIPAKKLMMEKHWKQKQFLSFYVWLVKLIGRQKFQETEEKSERDLRLCISTTNQINKSQSLVCTTYVKFLMKAIHFLQVYKGKRKCK